MYPGKQVSAWPTVCLFEHMRQWVSFAFHLLLLENKKKTSSLVAALENLSQSAPPPFSVPNLVK